MKCSYSEHFNIVISSSESQKGIITIPRCSIESQKGAIAIDLFIAIAPFWFAKKHRWIVVTPFWLSTDNIFVVTAIRQLRARRALLQIKDFPLRTRRALSPYTLYCNSALLVLNRTSFNCNNALLALNWRIVVNKKYRPLSKDTCNLGNISFVIQWLSFPYMVEFCRLFCLISVEKNEKQYMEHPMHFPQSNFYRKIEGKLQDLKGYKILKWMETILPKYENFIIYTITISM